GALAAGDGRLRRGSPAEKARFVAQSIINAFGVDVGMLDSELAGAKVADDPATQAARQLREEMRRELQPVFGWVNQQREREAYQRSRLEQEAAGELQEFGQTHEFMDRPEVREHMATLLDGYAQRGLSLSTEEAYDL